MNFKLIIKGVVILSLLSLLQVTQAQQAMDNHGKMDMKESTQKMRL